MEAKIREYINFKYHTNYKPDTKIDEDKGYRGNVDGYDEYADIPLIEIKTFGSRLKKTYYEYQCQFYMNLFDVDKCLLVGYKRGEDFYCGMGDLDEYYFNFNFDPDNIVVYELTRNNKKIEEIEQSIKDFRELINELKEEHNV